MSITITTADVKRKAMIPTSNTDYDSSISSLITEMQPAVEYSIADSYLADTSNTKLQAALKLGILELLTGEFLEQLRRELGATEQFTAAGVTLGAAVQTGVELAQQGATRLQPYLKAALPMMSESDAASTTSDEDTVFAVDEEVW